MRAVAEQVRASLPPHARFVLVIWEEGPSTALPRYCSNSDRDKARIVMSEMILQISKHERGSRSELESEGPKL